MASISAILKQVTSGRGIPRDVREAIPKDKKRVWRGLLVLNLYDRYYEQDRTVHSYRSYLCTGTLDECLGDHGRELLDLLLEIVRVFLNNQVSLTRRSYIAKAIMRCFSEAVGIPVSRALVEIGGSPEMGLPLDCL